MTNNTTKVNISQHATIIPTSPSGCLCRAFTSPKSAFRYADIGKTPSNPLQTYQIHPSVIVQSHYFLFWTIMFRYFEMYYYVYWDYSTVSHFKIVVVFHVHFLSPFLIGLTTQESTFVFLGRDLQSETTQATKWQGYPLSSYQLICLNYQHWPNLVTVTSPCGYVWCVYDKKAGQLKFPNRFDGCVESSHQSHHLGVGRTRNWEIRPRKLNLRIEIVWHSKPLLLGI